MNKTPKQDISDAVQALPYKVFEIKAKPVLGGKKREIPYIGMTRKGISQRMRELKDWKAAGNVALCHCLNSEPYQVVILGRASSEKEARAMKRKHIASRKRVLNKSGTSLSGNSVYHQYLRKHDLKPNSRARKMSKEDFEGRAKECSVCGNKKEADEFYVTNVGALSLCKVCFKVSVSRDMGRADYRAYLKGVGKLKPKRAVAKSKKCNCCGKRKKAKDMGRNSMSGGGLQPTCQECHNKAESEGIKVAVLRKRYGNH